jgi:hypothetical protein
MYNTCYAAVVVVVSQRVCLFAPSVTVCAVVCVRHMTCVPEAGLSTELWRFSTPTRDWERATVVNGAGPSGRSSHVMTSVGLDLWVHGGTTNSGQGDTSTTHMTLLPLPR